ncbi:MAG: chalcone isomerase family protein [Rhodoferax sp.]
MKALVAILVCGQLVGAAYAQKNNPPAARVPLQAGSAGDGVPGEVLAGQRLVRNGAGFRMKGSAKVSQIQIFAVRRFSSLEELSRMDGPKRVLISLLSDAPSNFMGKGLTRGIEDNTPKSELSGLVPMLVRMGAIFNQHKTLNAGSKVLIDWVPGQGMQITINGAVQGEPFRDPALFHALTSIWLGPAPVDAQLKRDLLAL